MISLTAIMGTSIPVDGSVDDDLLRSFLNAGLPHRAEEILDVLDESQEMAWAVKVRGAAANSPYYRVRQLMSRAPETGDVLLVSAARAYVHGSGRRAISDAKKGLRISNDSDPGLRWDLRRILASAYLQEDDFVKALLALEIDSKDPGPIRWNPFSMMLQKTPMHSRDIARLIEASLALDPSGNGTWPFMAHEAVIAGDLEKLDQSLPQLAMTREPIIIRPPPGKMGPNPIVPRHGLYVPTGESPSPSRIWAEFGLIAALAGLPHQARTCLKRTRGGAKRDAMVGWLCGRTLRVLGDFKQAEGLLSHAAQNFAVARYDLALALADLGRIDEATAAFQLAIQSGPADHPLIEAEIHARLGRGEHAQRLLDQLEPVYILKPSFWFVRAELASRRQDSKAVKAAFEQILILDAAGRIRDGERGLAYRIASRLNPDLASSRLQGWDDPNFKPDRYVHPPSRPALFSSTMARVLSDQSERMGYPDLSDRFIAITREFQIGEIMNQLGTPLDVADPALRSALTRLHARMFQPIQILEGRIQLDRENADLAIEALRPLGHGYRSPPSSYFFLMATAQGQLARIGPLVMYVIAGSLGEIEGKEDLEAFARLACFADADLALHALGDFQPSVTQRDETLDLLAVIRAIGGRYRDVLAQPPPAVSLSGRIALKIVKMEMGDSTAQDSLLDLLDGNHWALPQIAYSVFTKAWESGRRPAALRARALLQKNAPDHVLTSLADIESMDESADPLGRLRRVEDVVRRSPWSWRVLMLASRVRNDIGQPARLLFEEACRVGFYRPHLWMALGRDLVDSGEDARGAWIECALRALVSGQVDLAREALELMPSPDPLPGPVTVGRIDPGDIQRGYQKLVETERQRGRGPSRVDGLVAEGACLLLRLGDHARARELIRPGESGAATPTTLEGPSRIAVRALTAWERLSLLALMLLLAPPLALRLLIKAGSRLPVESSQAVRLSNSPIRPRDCNSPRETSWD